MKGIIQAMLEEIYVSAEELAKKNNQVVGEKKDYYITLQQLEGMLAIYND